MLPDKAALAAALCEIALRAGREILAVYASDFAVRGKADASPVTEADTRAERVILEGLGECAPGVPVVAEESVAAGNVPDVGSGPFFLVDPLDGTREFIGRNGEFTVNVALIEDGVPTVGVVHLPALDETFWTAGDGVAWRARGGGNAGRAGQRPRRPASSPGAGRAGSAGAATGSNGAGGDAGIAASAGAGTTGAAERIACRTPGDGGLVVTASRSHRDPETDRYLERFEVAEIVSAGSSLKFCRIAEGAADLYPRLGRTMEWDVAAGHAIVNAAGGSVETLEGAPLAYGKPGFDNPRFVARGLPRERA